LLTLAVTKWFGRWLLFRSLPGTLQKGIKGLKGGEKQDAETD
jgi:hypothetical protein